MTAKTSVTGVDSRNPAVEPLDILPDEARRATNRHYELPPEVFKAFLDQRLKYSSGLYRMPDLTLEEAQTEKLRFVADRIGVSGGERLLDVGCGWGSLALFMAQERGCVVTGITPSAVQAEFVNQQARRAGAADRVRIQVGSFSDIQVDGRFDAITMLGSIVHMPDRVSVLQKAAGVLRRDGTLYLSESCFRNRAVYQEFASRPGTKHVTEDIFGFADMVPLSALIEAVELSGLSLQSLDDLTAHYHRTIEEWERRALANRERIEAAAPGMSDPLARYLRVANAGWGYTTKHYALTASKSRLATKATP